MAQVKFAFGDISAYNGLSTKDVNTLYFITDATNVDIGRIYKGSTILADKSIPNVVFTTTVPTAADAKEGVLYVVTANGETGLYAKNGETIDQVSGGEITGDDIANGAITFDKFSSDSIATEISVDPTTASESKVTTEKAVATLVNTIKEDLETQISTLGDNFDTVKDAFVNVSIGTSTTEGKFSLNFYKASSPSANPISVELDKEQYLLNADLSEDGQNLVLTIQTINPEGTPATKDIEVPLATLVATAKTVKTVDTAIDVQLGNGGTLGGYKTGDTIAIGTPVQTVIAKLLAKQVPPTYVAPTITVANNGGTASGSYEIGTSITPKIRATFTQKDAGALTNIQFKKGSTNVGTASTTSPADYTEDAFTLSAITSFNATATYGEGAIKNDNLGDPYPTGHIAAGSKTSSNYTYTPYLQGYFYGVLSTTSAEQPLTSAIIRSGSKKNGAYAAGNLPLISASSVANRKRIFVACPATNTGVTKVVMPSAMNADCTADFVKQAPITVEGANGYTGVSYNVWVYEPASISDDQTFTVTLG